MLHNGERFNLKPTYSKLRIRTNAKSVWDYLRNPFGQCVTLQPCPAGRWETALILCRESPTEKRHKPPWRSHKYALSGINGLGYAIRVSHETLLAEGKPNAIYKCSNVKRKCRRHTKPTRMGSGLSWMVVQRKLSFVAWPKGKRVCLKRLTAEAVNARRTLKLVYHHKKNGAWITLQGTS